MDPQQKIVKRRLWKYKVCVYLPGKRFQLRVI